MDNRATRSNDLAAVLIYNANTAKASCSSNWFRMPQKDLTMGRSAR
jgi:hypothetical protein